MNRACVSMCMVLEQPLTVVLEPCLYARSYDSRVTRESCRNHACVWFMCVILARLWHDSRVIRVFYSRIVPKSCRNHACACLCLCRARTILEWLENRAEIMLVYVCVCVVLVRFSYDSRVTCAFYSRIVPKSCLCVFVFVSYSFDSRTVLELCESRASVCVCVQLGGLHEST